MIGSRASLAAATVVALVLGLGAGSPRPELEIAARASILEHAGATEAALATLRQRLVAALEAGRAGTARVVAGDAAPGPMFEGATDEVLAALDAAVEAIAARDALAGARSAMSPRAVTLPPAPDPAALASVGAQLQAAADAAEEFVVVRGRAESVAPTLLAALDALEAGETEAADALVAEARAALDAVEGWEVGVVSLPVWISTASEMIDTMERLVTATRASDAAGAEAAAADFAALAEEAPMADRALRIALGEGGSSVAAAALGRLASLLAATDELRNAVVIARQAAGR